MPDISQPSIGAEPRAAEFGRAALIHSFNALLGTPTLEIEQMQRQFINGEMPIDEAVSYERYCRYMLSVNS